MEGGTAHGLNNQLVCLWGVPSPVYKGVEEGEGPSLYGAPWRSPTPSRSRFPPSFSPSPTREGGGNPTLGGSRTPPGRAIEGRRSALLHSFIYRGGGTP